MNHEARVALYVKIINTKFKGPLNEFAVALMRNTAPTKAELEALNEALAQLGWKR